MCLNETYSKIHVSKHLSDTLPTQNKLKQGDALCHHSSILPHNKPTGVLENQVGLEMNGTHQLFVYADDVNFLGDSINTTKENKETLLGARWDIGLERKAEKTKYTIKSHHQNSEQNQDTRIANESFENVANFKCMRMTLTNQNEIHDEIKCRLNSGNTCYYSVQNLLSSCLT
jgi:hypothetical protein